MTRLWVLFLSVLVLSATAYSKRPKGNTEADDRSIYRDDVKKKVPPPPAKPFDQDPNIGDDDESAWFVDENKSGEGQGQLNEDQGSISHENEFPDFISHMFDDVNHEKPKPPSYSKPYKPAYEDSYEEKPYNPAYAETPYTPSYNENPAYKPEPYNPAYFDPEPYKPTYDEKPAYKPAYEAKPYQPDYEEPYKPAYEQKPYKPAYERPYDGSYEDKPDYDSPFRPAYEPEQYKPAYEEPARPAYEEKPYKPTYEQKPYKPAYDNPSEGPYEDKPDYGSPFGPAYESESYKPSNDKKPYKPYKKPAYVKPEYKEPVLLKVGDAVSPSVYQQDEYHAKHEQHGYAADYKAASIPGKPGVDYPNYTAIPPTKFDCYSQKTSDENVRFADPEFRCQVFHVCLPDRMESFLCPLGTVFDQYKQQCDWWYEVDCKY